MSEKSPGEIMLNNVRLAFTDAIFEKKRVGEDGDPRFSCALLMTPDHPDLSRLKEHIRKVAASKWQDKAGDVLNQLAAQDRLCLHKGDTKPEYDGFPGNYFVSCNSKIRPLIVNRDRTPLSAEDGVIYAGCYANVKIDVWAQPNYGKRINAQLMGVQFVKDGEPFGGGRVAAPDEFTDMSDVDADSEFSGGEEAGEDFGDLI